MIIIDNFLSDGEFKDKMTADENWQTNLSYNWFDRQATNDDSHWIQFCYYVWNVTNKPNFAYDGFEYWTNIQSQSGKQDLPWHVDHDEHLYDTTKNLVTTDLGLVYYCHKELPEGGYLEIDHGGEYERIKPVPNRLIIFNPSIAHRVTPVTSGVRRTIACNVWKNKPQEDNFV